MLLTTTVVDSFQRANQNPLDPTNWTYIANQHAPNAVLQIMNNECETTADPQQDGKMWNINTVPNDSFVEVQVQRIRTLSALFMYLGDFGSPGQDFYKVYDVSFFTSDGINYFFQVEGLDSTIPGQIIFRDSNVPFQFVNGDRLGLAVIGSTMYVLQNGKVLGLRSLPSPVLPRKVSALQIALFDGPPWDTSDIGLINFQAGGAALSSLQFTQLASDTFNRANENPLANGQWTTFAAFGVPLQIVSNVCEAVSPNGFGAAQYTGIVWPNDQWAEIKVTALTTNSDIALAIRCDSGFSNYLEVDIQPSPNNVKVAVGVSGVATTLGTFPTPSVGDVYRIVAVGTTWYLFQNGTQIGTGAIGATPASGNVVLANFYASVPSDTTVDNFAGGSVVLIPSGLSAPAQPLFSTDAGPGSNTPVKLFSAPGLGLEVHVSPTSPATDYIKAVSPTPLNLTQGVNPDSPSEAAFSPYAVAGKKVVTAGVKFANPA